MNKSIFSKKIILLFLVLIVLHFIPRAQILLSGKITDRSNNKNLTGASLYIPDLKIGTTSKNNGSYTIKNIPNGNYLVVISHVGFAAQTQEIYVHGISTANFSLVRSTTESPEVIITGVNSATEQQTNPAPVSIVSKNILLQTTSDNIIDALKYSPGVSQISMGPAISKPVIRGLGYNRVVVVNDGIRQEGQQFGDEFGIEIDPYSVHKVEILRGPASLSYGSDAMAGVINMIAAPTLSEGEIKGDVQSIYQTNNGMYGGSANIAGNSNGITFDARYSYTDAHAFKNKYDGYVFNSGYAQNNIKGTIGINRKWGYSRFTASSFNLKTGIVEAGRDETTGQFTKHVLASDGTDSVVIVGAKELSSYNHHEIIHQNVRHYKAVWDNSFAIGNDRLNVRLAFQQNHRQEANDASLGNIYNIYYLLNTVNYDLHYTFSEKNHFEFSVGSNGMQQSSQNKGILFLVPAYQLFDIGLFAITKKSFDKFSISGGIRFDNRKLSGEGLFLDQDGRKTQATNVDAVHRFTAYKSNFSGMSGSLGATYDFTKSFYGKINLSRGFRAPNIAESGSNGIHDGTPFYEIGDNNLKPEQSWQIDAAIGFITKDISAELTLFNNNINNYIFPEKLASVFGGDSIRRDITAATSGPTFKYISGDAVLKGGELLLKYHPHQAGWFNFNTTFSIVNSIQKNQPDSTKYLPYTPPYKLVSGITINAKNTGPNFKNSYFRIDFEHSFKQDKIYFKFGNETITPGYSLLNMGIGTDIHTNGHKIFSVNFYARNIFDIAYQSNMSRLKYGDVNNVTGRTGVYEMGRSFNFKLNIPINF